MEVHRSNLKDADLHQSNLSATVSSTGEYIRVTGHETIAYDFKFTNNVFELCNPILAECYVKWKRVLAVVDSNVEAVYGTDLRSYFEYHKIHLTLFKADFTESDKSMDSLFQVVDAMKAFGIERKEPVLVVGGGVVTDVAGFACAIYRRNTPFIRVPTTLIGLIDASVSIKVAVNYGGVKNRLGAYFAPDLTILDPTFLKTLPQAHIRNGMAELIKISACADKESFELLETFCESLLASKFGQLADTNIQLRQVADTIIRRAIEVMLQLESSNLHEVDLYRVIAFGHTWSPLFELAAEPHLRHGHAITIDMAYTCTVAKRMGLMGSSEHARFLRLLERVGLAIHHPVFDSPMLLRATESILQTRNGKLRLPIPGPIGSCTFVDECTDNELIESLTEHGTLAGAYDRGGEGLDMYTEEIYGQ